MAIKPILSTLPFMKLFRPEKPPVIGQDSSRERLLPQDVVSISQTALDKMTADKPLSPTQAQDMAAETGRILAASADASLGLPADFVE